MGALMAVITKHEILHQKIQSLIIGSHQKKGLRKLGFIFVAGQNNTKIIGRSALNTFHQLMFEVLVSGNLAHFIIAINITKLQGETLYFLADAVKLENLKIESEKN